MPARSGNVSVDRRVNFVIPGLVLAVAVVAVVVPPVAPGQETLRLAGVPLPTMCMLRAATGMPCAGCGLTRSWIAALHGEWGWSFEHHRLGAVALAYLLLQAIRHAAIIARPSAGMLAVAGRRLDLAAIALGVLFVWNWLARLAGELFNAT